MEQKKSYRTALYTRVSTVDQNSELQLRDLQSHADFEGWQIVDTYQDTISGYNANRPGLSRLLADALARNSIACWFGSWTDSAGHWWTASTTSAHWRTMVCGLSPSLRDWTRTSATRHPNSCSTC